MMMKFQKPSKEEVDKIQLRSEEILEIIGIVPNWFVRLGISVVFIFMLVILICCWFFKYPDIISAKIELTANNYPASIIAKTNGKIEKLFILDNQNVKQKEILAVIENTANYVDVLKVKSLLDSLALVIQFSNLIKPLITSDIYKLGNIQPSYSAFLKHYNDYKNFVALNYHQKRIESLKHEIAQQNDYMDGLINKFKYSKEQLLLSMKQFHRDSLLFKNEVISALDFEKAQTQYLQVKSNSESNHSEILSLNVQITKLNQSILDLESQKLELSNQQISTLKESYELLLAQIADWENLYLIKASVAGKITFTRFWNNNQNIKIGDVVFTVIPPEFKSYIAKIQLPVQSSGKVRVGQKVIIKLDDYPYMEYGLLHGKITKISLVPDNDTYFVELVFPAKLVTTYNKDISFKNKLEGTAEIITKNQRLLYKFIYPIKALISYNNLK